MKRNRTKKLAISATTVRTLRPLADRDAAQVAGATNGGICVKATVGGCAASYPCAQTISSCAG